MGLKQVAAALGLLGLAAALDIDMPITDCAGLSGLNDKLELNNVTATIRSNDLFCDVWTTIVVPANRQLTIEAEDPDYRVKFTNIRFEVEARGGSGDNNHYDLIFSPDVKFYTSIDANVFDGTQVKKRYS